MNPFQGLPEFLAVAETRGFSTAGRRLGVSTSHVSRQVAALEERLGVRLLRRTTRRVALTDAGREYSDHVQNLLLALDEANRQASDDRELVAGRLRIAAPADMSEYIAPVLARFAAAHPRIEIQLDLSPTLVDLTGEGFDLGIRYGAVADDNLVARRLADAPLALAAAPTYLAARGTPARPQDLTQHDGVITVGDRWPLRVDGRTVEVQMRCRWRANHALATIAACRAGLGIACLPQVTLAPALADGSLVPVLEACWGAVATVWVAYPGRRFVPLRTRRAMEALLDAFADWRLDGASGGDQKSRSA